MMRTISGAAAALVALSAAPAFAAGVQLTNKVMVEQRSSASDGTVQIKLVPAQHAVPGDRLVYVLDYHNSGSQPVSDMVLNNALPKDIAYRAPAAGSPAPEVSVDGRTFGTLAAMRVTTPSGSRAATAADVTHVRWRVPGALAAGGSGEVAFQAVIK